MGRYRGWAWLRPVKKEEKLSKNRPFWREIGQGGGPAAVTSGGKEENAFKNGLFRTKRASMGIGAAVWREVRGMGIGAAVCGPGTVRRRSLLLGLVR